MKIIKKLSEMIIDEVDGAKEYATEALMLKDEKPEIANMFYNMSNEELGHVNALHIAVVSLINEYRAEHGDPPEGMMAIYNFLHEKQIKSVAEVKAMLAQFRE